MKLRTPFFLAVLAMTVSTYCPPNHPAHNTLQERLHSTNGTRFVCIAGRVTISTKQIRTPWRSLRLAQPWAASVHVIKQVYSRQASPSMPSWLPSLDSTITAIFHLTVLLFNIDITFRIHD